MMEAALNRNLYCCSYIWDILQYMANTDVRPIELLLQVIADELYIARMDCEHEGADKTNWKDSGRRDLMVKRIEEARDKFDSYPVL
jgi:hypothetical protein